MPAHPPPRAHELRRLRLPGGGWGVRKAPAPWARADVARRLAWEGDCLAALGGRRGVLACLARDARDPGAPALVLEWAPGGSLAERLRRAPGPRPAAEVLAVGRALCGALSHVHAAGLVHRDVKPSNVLVAADGGALLADFGVAAPSGGRTPLGPGWEEHGPVGTLGYAAPEQLAGAVADARADVYALGAVLCELATGRPVWELGPGEDEAGLRRRVVGGERAVVRVAGREGEVLGRALEADPGRRFGGVGELGEALGAG